MVNQASSVVTLTRSPLARSSVVVEQVDLVDNDQSDKIRVAGIGRLSSDDIPFFRCRDDNLGLRDLLLRELTVTSQLSNSNVES